MGGGKRGAGSGIPKVAGNGRKREKLCNIAHMENKVDWHCRNQEREFLLLPSCPDLVSLLLVGQIFPSHPIPSEADSNKKCIKLETIIMEINTPL